MTASPQLVQKLWSYCGILRDDGLSYSDYVEQLTYLLFLKMADERSRPPFLELDPLPRGFDWSSLLTRSDEALLEHYEKILRRLGRRTDLFGMIYKNALSKFRDPGKFQRLVVEIGSVEWSLYDSDVKGLAYEGLLEKTAAESKAGAGQYFTPRPLVDAVAEVMQICPGETVCDPACGTGGFLLAAYRRVSALRLTKAQRHHLTHKALRGVELVDAVARLCLMNLVLHGVGGQVSPVAVRDALEGKPEETFDVVLANPPFGRKSGGVTPSESGDPQREQKTVGRDDFWANTSNKQLNFLQHVFTLLKRSGRAAVVLPDNALFEAGAGAIIRRELLKNADVHTLLRLPPGIFYAPGIKANVLFFDRVPPRAKNAPGEMWIYDLRTNLHFTLKENTLRRGDLDDFVTCFCADNRGARKETERFRKFSHDALLKRDRVSFDIFWLRDESLDSGAHLPPPETIAADIVSDLEAALEQFSAIAEDLVGSADGDR